MVKAPEVNSFANTITSHSDFLFQCINFEAVVDLNLSNQQEWHPFGLIPIYVILTITITMNSLLQQYIIRNNKTVYVNFD